MTRSLFAHPNGPAFYAKPGLPRDVLCEGHIETVDGRRQALPDFVVARVPQNVAGPNGVSPAAWIAAQLNKARDFDRLAAAFNEASAEYPIDHRMGEARKREQMALRLNYICTVLDPLFEQFAADQRDGA